MSCYSIDLKTRKYVEGYWLLSLARNLSNKYKKKNIECCYKSRTRYCNKTTEAIGELIGNKIADKIVKLKPMFGMNLRNAE